MTPVRQILSIADQIDAAQAIGKAVLDGQIDKKVARSVAEMLVDSCEKQKNILRQLAERLSGEQS